MLYKPDNALIEALDEYSQQNTADVPPWYYVCVESGSFSLPPRRKGHHITIRRGASRREISGQLPGDNTQVLGLGSELATDSDWTSLQSCVPRRCSTLSFSELPRSLLLNVTDGPLLRSVVESMAVNASALPGDAAYFATVCAVDLLQTVPHFGKYGRRVVAWTGDQHIKVQRRPLNPATLFLETKTYLLVGLTCQMGQSICRWMVATELGILL